MYRDRRAERAQNARDGALVVLWLLIVACASVLCFGLLYAVEALTTGRFVI